MPDLPGPKIIRVHDFAEAHAKRRTDEAVEAIHEKLSRPSAPLPEAELQTLLKAALGDTGQSRTCRYLLYLLVGAEDPTGFKGEGLLEMRTLDRKLADTFLTVLNWWRGPTQSDQPLYDILQRLEDAFSKESPKK